MMKSFVVSNHGLIVFILIIGGVMGQDDCSSKESCGACIQEAGCVWCEDADFSGQPHCFSQLASPNCASLVNPRPEYSILRDTPLETKPGAEAVQIKPQRASLRLRKGETFDLKFEYAQAANFPIDLYYLMDLSSSMAPQKQKLADLGDDLVRVMRNITSNFKLGFGSFVDKTDMPFVSTVPEKLLNPCSARKPCAPAYSFINHQSLMDGDSFAEGVHRARVSGNLDSPEGGFDALMQAMVCKKEIGWREQARHLIVFSTDAPFHIAGDGKLAGVVEPNDAKCHMEGDHYTASLKYDYPSISHIDYVAKQNGFYIFFAIVNTNSVVFQLYKNLQMNIENSEIAALQDNSNIIKLIQNFYNSITSSITMTHTADSNIQIEYTADCASQISGGCSAVNVSDTINFTAKIKAVACSKDNAPQKIIIRPGALSETLELDLEVICDCGCEATTSGGRNECNNKGVVKCGICSCDEGHYGKRCDCDGQNDSSENNLLCIKPNDTEICSGLGSCKCDTCECIPRIDPNERIYGKYCECDNYSCPKGLGNRLCSGNGNCDCSNCTCSAGWSGEACSCRDDNTLCTLNNHICGNKGQCICGECKCEQGYYGKYCEECALCSGGRCEELKPCVECKAYQTGDYVKDCDLKCTEYPVQLADEIDEVDSEKTKVCRFLTKDDCHMIFKYVYDDVGEINIIARKEIQCPSPINIYAVVFGVIGSILLAGIIMLAVWKLFTSIHDRREYAKFQNESNAAKWNRNDNPLFRTPVSKFENPTFRKQRDSTSSK